jgi:hypothetical protein
MTDLDKLIGVQLPAWVPLVGMIVIGVVAILVLLWLLLFFFSKIRKLLLNEILPAFYSREDKRRRVRRHRFADHIEREIRRLDSLENWSDYRFTELEAEVEAEGRRTLGLFPFFGLTRSGLRREPSLSKALKSSEERLILVEGDPGSGKSVALRYIAASMARSAMDARSTKSVIPIYINLKELDRHEMVHIRRSRASGGPLGATQIDQAQLHKMLIDSFSEDELKDICLALGVDYENLPGDAKAAIAREMILHFQREGRLAELAQRCAELRPLLDWYVFVESAALSEEQPAIDQELIRSFVLKSLNRANDRDITQFLDDEFERGREEGGWFFLFDSFDELPDVLSATEANVMIRSYADAIADFLQGFNTCRGIIASRQFRGPGQLGWPRFRILPLAEDRRLELVRRADLGSVLEREFIGRLGIGSPEIRSMSDNPLFLGLLCEHMRAGHAFPNNAHNVFEAYVETRLTRDRERLRWRFMIEPGDVRAAAETVAFCMAADAGVGLSASRESLKDAIHRQQFEVRPDFDGLLDALEYIKLARTEKATEAAGSSQSFTFAHRRFQEYFATCVVQREPGRVSPHNLLYDARWRETAVVLCQTQRPDSLSPLIEEARRTLVEMTSAVPGLIENPLECITASTASDEKTENQASNVLLSSFPWPTNALHVLGILQDGFSSRMDLLPLDIRLLIGRLLLSATSSGTLSDRKWSLEVVGGVPEPVLLYLLRSAFASESQWLKEVAYRQAIRLECITEDIARSIRLALLNLAVTGRLPREQHTTRAHLERIDKSGDLRSVMRLLLWLSFIDGGLHLLVILALCIAFLLVNSISSFEIILWIITITFSHVCLNVCIVNYYLLSSSTKRLGRVKNRNKPDTIMYYIYSIMGIFSFNMSMTILFYIRLTIGTFLFRSTLSAFFLYVYASSWGFFALIASETGLLVHETKWIIIPLWPVIYFLRNMDRGFRALVFTFTKPRALISLFLIVLIFSIYFASLSYLIRLIENTPIFKYIIYILLIVPSSAAIIRFGFSTFRPWFHDWKMWRRWQSSSHNALTGEQLLELIAQYQTESLSVRLIRTVREQGLIVADKKTELLVARLALTVEYSLHGRYSANKNYSNQQPEENAAELESLEQWMTQYTQKNKIKLARLGPEFLDEISILREYVRANSRDSLPAGAIWPAQAQIRAA